jgi:DnaD/phage-associated family protein
VKWADEGIDSMEAADNKIKQSRQSGINWSRVSSVFGLKNVGSPTAKQLEYADRWIGEWKFSDDMLRAAYERCVDNTGKLGMSYINKILERWHSAGIITPDDIERLDTKKPSVTKKQKASYDISVLEKIQ